MNMLLIPESDLPKDEHNRMLPFIPGIGASVKVKTMIYSLKYQSNLFVSFLNTALCRIFSYGMVCTKFLHQR